MEAVFVFGCICGKISSQFVLIIAIVLELIPIAEVSIGLKTRVGGGLVVQEVVGSTQIAEEILSSQRKCRREISSWLWVLL